MGLLSGRLGTALVTLFLVGSTFVLVGLAKQFSIATVVLPEFPTVTSQVAVFLGLSTVGVLAVRNAIRTKYRVLWLLGVLFMQSSYTFLGIIILEVTTITNPVEAVGIVGGIVVGVFTVLLAYGFWSSRSFQLWEVYAVLLGLSAAVLIIAATRIQAVGFVAGAILLLALMMYVIHVIARFKKSVPRPLRNGTRLYVAITGLPIELALYLPTVALRRLI
jgi:hypothetical protein